MRRIVLVALVVSVIAAAGCGPARSRVHGTVRYKGKPLNAGMITFLAPDNQNYRADIGPDGTYEVAGVARGKVRVSVLVEQPRPMPRPDPVKGADSFAGKEAKGDDEAKLSRQPTMRPSSAVQIPAMYGDPNSSGLSFDLKEPSQEFSPDLK
jgi:hypothetical protein